MDKVVHFELPANDLNRAKKFYRDTFGWQLQDVPEMQYVLASSVAVDEKTHMPKEAGAINGGLLKKNNVVSNPSFAINVDNIDQATEKIKKSGGTIVKEKAAVGDMGFIVYFKDTEGNTLSIWQSARR